MIHLANLYVATLNTTSTREVNVVAETQEEAQAKSEAQAQEGETVAQVVDKGTVVS